MREPRVQQPDDVRAALVKEIRRREQQLASLREALAQLDAALEAAAKAHAASLATTERSLTSQAAAMTREVKSGMHTVGQPVPPPQPVQADPAPASPPAPVQPPVVQTAKIATSAPATPAPVATSTIEIQHVPLRPSNSGPYANMKVWRAVQEMLTEHRKSMTLDEIVRHLQEGGASLGSSPLRTVSTAIGYMNDKIFHVSKSGGETYVNLLRPADH